MTLSKTCSKCKVIKPLEAFNKSKKYAIGVRCECRECQNAAARTYKPNRTEYQREHYKNNKVRYLEAARRYKAKRPGLSAKEYNANKEYFKEYGKNWRRNNSDKNTAKSNRYRAGLDKATPKWLTEEQHKQILAFYSEAKRLTIESGILYEVDHIIPLNGKTVCGLHVPWNLQILTKVDNIKKSNKLGELRWPR